MLDRVGSVAGTFTAAEHNHTFRNPNHLKGERVSVNSSGMYITTACISFDTPCCLHAARGMHG